MPKKRFSEEQIAFALRQAEAGTTVGEICRKTGIAEATFGSLRVPQVSAPNGICRVPADVSRQCVPRAGRSKVSHDQTRARLNSSTPTLPTIPNLGLLLIREKHPEAIGHGLRSIFVQRSKCCVDQLNTPDKAD